MPAGGRRTPRDILALFRRQFTRSCLAALESSEPSKRNRMGILVALRLFRRFAGRLCRYLGGEPVEVAWFA